MQTELARQLPRFVHPWVWLRGDMQFLVYLTVLMVSISTVLLEVHWLTSPPPQSKPAIQAAGTPAQAPKVEGPNAALSPVYPKKSEPGESMVNTQRPATGQQQPQQTQLQQGQAPAAVTTTTPMDEPAKKAQAETTGVATHAENTRQTAATPVNTPPRTANAQAAAAQTTGVASNNRCDVDACASMYKSFRVSDCTYQPYGGERRLCTKASSAARSAGREPNAEGASTRRSTRDVELRERQVERRARLFRDDEDNDRPEIRDSVRDEPSLFLFGGRGRW